MTPKKITALPGSRPSLHRGPTTGDDEAAISEALRDHSAGTSPGFMLWHANLRWQRLVGEALGTLGLTHVQFKILSSIWWLGRDGAVPNQRKVAEHAGVDQVMASQVLRTLADAGLVTRSRDAADGRAFRLAVTPAGYDLARRSVVLVDRIDAEFFAPAGDQAVLLAILRALAGRDRAGGPAGDGPDPATGATTARPEGTTR